MLKQIIIEKLTAHVEMLRGFNHESYVIYHKNMGSTPVEDWEADVASGLDISAKLLRNIDFVTEAIMAQYEEMKELGFAAATPEEEYGEYSPASMKATAYSQAVSYAIKLRRFDALK